MVLRLTVLLFNVTVPLKFEIPPPPPPPRIGVFEPTVQLRPTAGGGTELVDATGAPVQTDAVVERAMGLLQASAGRSGVSLSALVTNGVPRVDASEPFMAAVTQIGGAAAATASGGGAAAAPSIARGVAAGPAINWSRSRA